MSASQANDNSLHVFHVHKDAVSAVEVVKSILYSASYDTSICKIDLVVSSQTITPARRMMNVIAERASGSKVQWNQPLLHDQGAGWIAFCWFREQNPYI